MKTKRLGKLEENVQQKNWRRFGCYHLTDPANITSIIFDGLLANDDGDIFLATSNHGYVLHSIAREQLFLPMFAVFAVYARGISGERLPDDVIERTAAYQVRLKQAVIRPQHLRFVGVCETWMSADYPKFGTAIKTRRELAGLTMQALAHKADTDQTTIAEIEREQRTPSQLLAARLATALGVAEGVLLRESLSLSND